MEPTTDQDLIDEDPPAEVVDLELEPVPPTVVISDVHQAGEQGIVQPIVSYPPPPPLPATDDAIIALLKKRRDDMTARVNAIESLLGFVESAGDLAVRVAKIERFLGMQGLT